MDRTARWGMSDDFLPDLYHRPPHLHQTNVYSRKLITDRNDSLILISPDYRPLATQRLATIGANPQPTTARCVRNHRLRLSRQRSVELHAR